MLDDSLSIYDSWDLEEPHIPPRSILNNLEPIGIGTPDVESFTSYIQRLAEVHCVTTRTLITRILPLASREEPTIIATGLIDNHSKLSLNGLTPFTRTLVDALEILTRRSDLSFLTMLTWSNILPPVNLFRQTAAWCPECFEEWQIAGRIIYEPLIWSIKNLDICLHHLNPLQSRYPHTGCNRSWSVLDGRKRPGYCPYCGTWLGALPSSTSKGSSEPEFLWCIWASQAVGEMLALAPTLSMVPKKDIISKFIRSSVRERTGGDTAEFSRILGVTKSNAWDWQYGGILPTLRHILSICRVMEVSPVDVVQGKPAAKKMWTTVTVPKQKTARPRHKLDHIEVMTVLQTVLARNDTVPPPMHSVARSIHFSQRTLYKNFPDLCRRISARFNAHKKSIHFLKIKGLQEEVKQAVLRLHNEGVYPSIRRVSKLLAQPGDLRYPEARTARLEAIRELEP